MTSMSIYLGGRWGLRCKSEFEAFLAVLIHVLEFQAFMK